MMGVTTTLKGLMSVVSDFYLTTEALVLEGAARNDSLVCSYKSNSREASSQIVTEWATVALAGRSIVKTFSIKKKQKSRGVGKNVVHDCLIDIPKIVIVLS